MSAKSELIKRFLIAARSLADQGMSKEAIMQFAKNEFGEITELFQKQIDNIFKRPSSGIENIKVKDEVFDDTVIKLPLDDTGQPFNPNNPLKQYGKPKQNRPDVYGLDDYDTTNMSDIKKQIIRTETKLGNLNPDTPDFKERAKILVDELEQLQNKMRDDKAKGGIMGYYTGGMVDVKPNLSDIGHGSDALMARTRLVSPDGQATTSTGLNYLLAEDNDNIRVPFVEGGRIGYATKGKVSLSDLESLQGLKKARGNVGGPLGLAALQAVRGRSAIKRNQILDKAIAKFTYIADNLDQEERSLYVSAFNNKLGELQLGYSTTMSGLKMDAADKVGIVPIDKETIYSAIVNMDLPKELKLKASAIGNAAGEEDLKFSLANNNLGITYDSESQEIKGQYQFDSKDGKLSIKPIVKKDADSNIEKRIEIEKAIDGGGLYLDATKGDDAQIDFTGIKDGNVLNLQKNIGAGDNSLSGDFTTELPLYMINENLKPTVSGDFSTENDINQYGIGANFPITENLSADISTQKYDDDTSSDKFGLYYNKPVGKEGLFSIGADIDTDRNKNLMAKFILPFGEGNFEESESLLMPYYEKEALKQKKLEEDYLNSLIYAGSDFNELKKAGIQNIDLKDFIGPMKMADGGRIGFAKGKIAKEVLDKGRRGFMKAAGAAGAGIAALKTGLLGFGKEASPVVEKVTENFSTTLSEAPGYFFDLVSKIKMFGKKSKIGAQERMDEYSYTGKNGDQYTLTEDISTGDAQITKDKMGIGTYGDKSFDTINDRTVLEYKAPKKDVDVETQKGTNEPAEYEEYRVEFDQDGTQAGADAIDESVQKEIMEEAAEIITKKADGGRIGFSKGKLVFENAAKFLNKIFGKENMAEMPRRDPEMYQGILEVVDMFRNRDKEGLIKYMRKFLPHKNDAEIEDFIIGSDGTEGIQGELIRLGSGRDYKAKIDMIKKSEEMGKLKDLEVTEEMIRKPNSSGGLAKMLGE